MDLMVQDIFKTAEYSKLRLLAGENGLYNKVTGCGILDYEFDEDVIDKYKHTNFVEGQLVLSSLLYTKDNEFMLLEAVKNLISKRCSGLIIKNIFKVNISSNVLRYADQHNFPIFIIKADELFFENIIVDVTSMIDNYKSMHHFEKRVDILLNSNSNNKILENLAKEINPSFGSDLIVIYFSSKTKDYARDFFSDQQFFIENDLLSISDRMFYYKNGFMIILSREMFHELRIVNIIEPLMKHQNIISKFTVGISNVHHNLACLKKAIDEALSAAILSFINSGEVMYYNDLGVYQLLLPFIGSDIYQDYRMFFIKNIHEYDSENQTTLYNTMVSFVLCNGDVDETAKKLEMHKNTVRYRIDKISKIIGQNILHKASYEKVALAIKIDICNEALNNFNRIK